MTEPRTPAAGVRWTDMLALPEIVELRRRRRTVTIGLGVATIALFAAFIVGFAYFPETLGSTMIAGIPLSLWVVLAEFVGTWVLVFSYFKLSATYLQPAADSATAAVTAVIRDADTTGISTREYSA